MMRNSFLFSILLSFVIFLFSCEKKEDTPKSNLSELLGFSIVDQSYSFTETADGNWVAKATPEDDLAALVAKFEISPKATMFIGSTPQTSGYNTNDFSNPLTYTVRAEDGSKSDYKVAIYKEAAIVSYSFIEFPNETYLIKDKSISAELPSGADLSMLTAKFEVTENAQLYVNDVEQVSETTQNNFTSPLTYTIKEQDGTVIDYLVTITLKENQAPIANAGENQFIILNTTENEAVIKLNGSQSSDEEGAIVKYEWTINGQGGFPNDVAIETSLAKGTHNVTLTVTDSEGASSSDDIVVDIKEAGTYLPIDADATQETKNLLANLATLSISDKFAFGQEFPMSFKLNGLRTDLRTSDCKDVSGDHPGVFGIDPHYMMYKTAEQKQLHINEAKAAYNNGAVVTFDFHQQSKNDRKIYMKDITNAEDKSLMYDVVNDLNEARPWFNAELDEIITTINTDLNFPVVFRLFHEMDGDWFWWGSKATNHSAALYNDFYKYAVNYIKARTNLVLFAWSPNSEVQEAYYPGDDYVDVVGFDIYEPNVGDLKGKLIGLSKFAADHGKVAVLAETGYRNNFINNAPGFWNDVILAAIEQGGREVRVAWALAWFNAPWASSQSDLFIPDANSPQNAKDNFIQFKNSSICLFMSEVNSLNIYQ
ncbi:glycosyl hydrolase [Saccharicrinis aurantiacus]|uniref:glycosyl hydrolase n=1 Tax=Saccharicrinis aurantiacus TaxID=1849719 RepID=UPI00094FBE45|nr:glycosyl hydrolase [Saccharicrinis aurantiacus]